jgi:hypothetical protein
VTVGSFAIAGIVFVHDSVAVVGIVVVVVGTCYTHL